MTALFVAVPRMFRAWRVFVPVVIVNAILQALLVLPGVLPYLSIAFIVVAVVSFILLVLSFGLVAAAMLQAAEGPASVSAAIDTVRSRLWPLLGWSVVLLVVVIIALALYVIPGMLVLAATPYLLLAVIDGQPHPLRWNFHVIARHWIGWLFLVIVMGILFVVLRLLVTLDGFFVRGALGALIAWLVLGVVASWFTCTWALMYRRPARVEAGALAS